MCIPLGLPAPPYHKVVARLRPKRKPLRLPIPVSSSPMARRPHRRALPAGLPVRILPSPPGHRVLPRSVSVRSAVTAPAPGPQPRPDALPATGVQDVAAGGREVDKWFGATRQAIAVEWSGQTAPFCAAPMLQSIRPVKFLPHAIRHSLVYRQLGSGSLRIPRGTLSAPQMCHLSERVAPWPFGA